MINELHLSAQRHPGAETCERWLQEPWLSLYLDDASQGLTRQRGLQGKPSTAAAMHVRRSVLRELAARAGVPIYLSPGPAHQPTPANRGDVTKFLTWLNDRPGPGNKRTAAVAALSAAGVSVADLADLRLKEVHGMTLERGWVRSRATGTTEVSALEVPAPLWPPVAEWLNTRPALVVSTRVPHLFVTTRPSHRGGAVYAAGMPISARGLERAHKRAVDEYYAVLTQKVTTRQAADISDTFRLGNLLLEPTTDVSAS